MAVAAIAVALILLSLKTLQAIRHLGVGKSFWMPVAVSGFLFFFGSVTAILFELKFELMPYTDEVVQVSRLLALCILVGGVYSYSRRVTKNLGEKFRIPSRSVQANAEADSEAKAHVSPLVPASAIAPPAQSIPDRIIQESMKKEIVQECKYRFGYLRTLPKDASIPDECLSCDKIIGCKHSQAKALESSPPQPS